MRKYPAENWKRFGQHVNDMRMRAGFRTTAAWSEAVERSDRMLLGLERGESVGPKTIEKIAEALAVDPGFLFLILSDPDGFDRQAAEEWPSPVDPQDSVPADRIWDLVDELAETPDDAGRDVALARVLGVIPSQSLLNEISRRLSNTNKKERSGDVAPAAQKSDNVRPFPATGDTQEASVPDETLKPAADAFDKEGDEKPGGSDQR